MIRATLATALLLCSTAFAGEKALMHCFAYTAIETATPADWEAFYKATDNLPKQVKTVKHVWYGKLQDNLFIYRTDAATSQKFRDGAKSATAFGSAGKSAEENSERTSSVHSSVLA